LVYTCGECGNTFEGRLVLKHRKRYCSTTCRTRSRNRRIRVARPTKIERRLWSALLRLGINARREWKVGRYDLDLALPQRQIAIEADGRYWHSTPRQREHDARRDAVLRAAGWTVLRFGEDEINASAKACAASVAKLLRTL
jgi:very-short-patch-repair endonuclease